MLGAFCLRLALGMVAFLPRLPSEKMHPRFFRTQFLTALGLCVVALMTEWAEASLSVRWFLSGSVAISLIGALLWTLEPAPLGRLTGMAALVLIGVTACHVSPRVTDSAVGNADTITAGLLLGSATTAMLVGHAYLISPGLTIKPLVDMLIVLGLCLMARIAMMGYSWRLISNDGVADLAWHTHLFFLIPRYLIGFGGPLVFGIMAYLSARIRSTQSATGILFVVVICVFLGELMSLVLTRTAQWPL